MRIHLIILTVIATLAVSNCNHHGNRPSGDNTAVTAKEGSGTKNAQGGSSVAATQSNANRAPASSQAGIPASGQNAPDVSRRQYAEHRNQSGYPGASPAAKHNAKKIKPLKTSDASETDAVIARNNKTKQMNEPLVGSLIGAIAGGGKGAAIGTLSGGAAGTRSGGKSQSTESAGTILGASSNPTKPAETVASSSGSSPSSGTAGVYGSATSASTVPSASSSHTPTESTGSASTSTSTSPATTAPNQKPATSVATVAGDSTGTEAQQEAQAEQQLQQAQVARQSAEQQQQALAQQADQAPSQSEQQAELQRQRLLQELNQVLQTKDTAKGLIVNISDVLFDTGKSTLKPSAKLRLAKVAGIILAYPDLRLEIDGYTDTTGTHELNQRLSERRAEAVREFLVSQGVSPNNVGAAGFAESDPIASNATAIGRQLNRRVEMVLTGSAIGQNQLTGPNGYPSTNGLGGVGGSTGGATVPSQSTTIPNATPPSSVPAPSTAPSTSSKPPHKYRR